MGSLRGLPRANLLVNERLYEPAQISHLLPTVTPHESH